MSRVFSDFFCSLEISYHSFVTSKECVFHGFAVENNNFSSNLPADDNVSILAQIPESRP